MSGKYLKRDIVRLREAVERQRQKVSNLGMMNKPIEPEAAVTSQANYQIDSDILQELATRYEKAFQAWFNDGMPE